MMNSITPHAHVSADCRRPQMGLLWQPGPRHVRAGHVHAFKDRHLKLKKLYDMLCTFKLSRRNSARTSCL